MKRAFTLREFLRAGFEPASEPEPAEAFVLWRSLPGYRKACRMLRRSGRRIHDARKRSHMASINELFRPLLGSVLDDLLHTF